MRRGEHEVAGIVDAEVGLIIKRCLVQVECDFQHFRAANVAIGFDHHSELGFSFGITEARIHEEVQRSAGGRQLARHRFHADYGMGSIRIVHVTVEY